MEATTLDRMKLSDKLRMLATERKVSQAEIAEKADVSQSQVSKWFRGVNTPDIHQSYAIANIFNVPLEFLANEDAEEMPASVGLSDAQARALEMVSALDLTVDEVIRRLSMPALKNYEVRTLPKKDKP